jgi:hypothetical protein
MRAAFVRAIGGALGRRTRGHYPPLVHPSSFVSRVLCVATLGLAVSVATPSWAEGPTEGEKLFLEGRKLMDEGSFDEACQRFERSYALEGALGSLLNLANCEEKRGRLRRALAHWKKAADTAGDQQKNRIYALGRAGDLEQKMPKLMVRVGATVTGATATLDGEALALGEKVPVDPGKHEVVVTAGTRVERKSIELTEGQPLTIDMMTEAAGSEGPRTGEAPGATAPDEPSTTNLAPWGWTSLVIGAASGIGFGVTGAMILGECSDDGVTADGTQSSMICADGKPDALGGINIATGVLAVVGVGLGVTLLVIDAGSQSPVQVGAVTLPGGGAALGMRGSF